MLSAIRLRRGTVAALLALALLRAYAQAAQPGASESGATDLGSVQTSAPGDSSGNTVGRAPDTALAMAPGHVPIDAEQPSDVVSHCFLQNDVILTENFNDVVRLTPSAMDIDPVGPGLQQNFGQSIRGFQYTQLDNDFDGIEIPNSPSNYSPQTAAYFMQHDIGTITVYGLDTNAVGKQDQFPIKSYNTVDLTLGYVFPLSATRRARLGVQVANLLNDRSLIAYNGLSSGAAALPLYFVNASRSVFFSVSAAL